jgi:hypothetical protein
MPLPPFERVVLEAGKPKTCDKIELITKILSD